MADKKRKTRDDNRVARTKRTKPPHQRKRSANGERTRRKGPRLPNKLRKELEVANRRNLSDNDDDDEDVGFDEEGGDVYEYEEAVAEEESTTNKRYDPVENFEYELPKQFEDEDVASDDDVDNDQDDGEMEDQEGDEDGGKHARMLQQITGLPVDAFAGKKRKIDEVVTEAYPESQFNTTGDILDGDGRISIHDLLGPLHGKSGFSELRKSVLRMERKSSTLPAPLPKSVREKVERSVAYEQSKKAITKWEPLVKRNREAPTLIFDEDTDLGFSSVGAIAAEFEPRTDFEKKMASLLNNTEVMEAHKKDGARLLELNKVSVEDVKDHQNRLAKMRSLLFRHEMKAKRIKKIKSKTYHRLLKKDRLKASSAEMEMNPEAAKELAMKQEFKRAEERLTLKHKNSSKWAKRILKRGLDVQDEGTRAALADQLHRNALLTRKMHSAKESSSDGSSDDDDDEGVSDTSDQDGAIKVLEKAKEKTTRVIEDDDEEPNSGVLSLPFMVRGLLKRKEVANEEAKLALEEYESSLNQLDDKREGTKLKIGNSSSRRVFGAPKKNIEKSSNGVKVDNYFGNSDSEDNMDPEEGNDDVAQDRDSDFQKDVHVDPNFLREESEIDHDSLFKNFNDIVKDPGPKTTYEVAMLASDSWKKMSAEDNRHAKSDQERDANGESSSKVEETLDDLGAEEVEDGNDSDSEGQMVDGILSAGAKSSYELPSQADLIRRAFAGDDVEDDFEKDKEEALNEEYPEPEKPALLPGWGQWTHVQRKKGLPSWMVEEHESAKKKREEALKKRKDALLKNVIISEKLDKKAEKLHTKTLPFPFTSKEVFEQSIRMPIGPEFNPVTVVGALNRPEVVKKAGVIIKPIKYEDVDPYQRAEEHQRNGEKQKKKNSAVSSGTQKKNGARSVKNAKTKTVKVGVRIGH